MITCYYYHMLFVVINYVFMHELNGILALAKTHSAPDHFNPGTISRKVGDNCSLKSSNLCKLVQSHETYYNNILQKDAGFKKLGSSIAYIAFDSNRTGITTFVELIIAVACTCKGHQTFIGRIMFQTF